MTPIDLYASTESDLFVTHRTLVCERLRRLLRLVRVPCVVLVRIGRFTAVLLLKVVRFLVAGPAWPDTGKRKAKEIVLKF